MGERPIDRRSARALVFASAAVLFLGAAGSVPAASGAEPDPPVPTSTTTPVPTSTTTPPSTALTTAPPATTRPPTSTTSAPPTTSPPAPAPPTTAPPTASPPTDGPVTVQAGTSANAFVRGADGALWWRQLLPSGWSSWISFGGVVTSNPAAATIANGSVYVFVRGGDNALWWQGYNGSSWSGWMSLGGFLTSDPVVVPEGSGLSVFVRGGDNALYRNRFAGTFSGWQNLGGALTSRPAAAVSGGSVFVFVRGGDLGMWVMQTTGASVGAWVSLGGFVTADPAAAADASGVSVFARGGEGGLYQNRLTGSWSGWQYLGGLLASAPIAVASGSDIHVFVLGSDGSTYWKRVVSGAPLAWQPLGGVATGDPAATIDDGGLVVFVRSPDGSLYVQRYVGFWTGWGQLGGIPLGSSPTAMSAPQINAAPVLPGPGLGFDACEAPALPSMSTWRLFSPFTSAGIYIGGVNRACSNAALNNANWVNTAVAQGWRLIPIYVGLQAPCSPASVGSKLSYDLFTAASQGASAAIDAANRAAVAGIGPGSPIYFDMEAYAGNDSACSEAVRWFTTAWVDYLHQRGYVAGLYGSLCSAIVDQAAVYDNGRYRRLDAVWIAAWNDTPNLFGFTGSCPLSDNLWVFHQRIHQYRGGHNETWGGVTINIDSNAVDGPLAPP